MAAAGRVHVFATVFDDHLPGIANLDADLRQAVRHATEAAGQSAVVLLVTSGWRSPVHQGRLLERAVATYGPQEARRWVATAQTSAHVSGEAVDPGGWDAMEWLARRGAEFGLCQVYANEPWHFELRPEATEGGCPPQYPDPSHEPRMSD